MRLNTKSLKTLPKIARVLENNFDLKSIIFEGEYTTVNVCGVFTLGLTIKISRKNILEIDNEVFSNECS